MIESVLKRVVLAIVVLILAVAGAPLATVLADDAPGDQQAGSGTRFNSHGASGPVHSWSESTNNWGTRNRGHEDVDLHGSSRGPNGGDDDGGGATGPIVCARRVLVIDPWTERVPGFNINAAPGSIQGESNYQGGIVNFKTRFWLDGDFDGHHYQKSGTAYIVQYGLDLLGNCVVTSSTPFGIRVHYWPISYTWDYGDGVKSQTTKCGQLYEPPSDCPFDVRTSDPLIEHYYRRSSVNQVNEVNGRSFNGYLVGVTVEFAMGISDDAVGATVTPLRQVTATAWLYYPVREVQSVITQ